MSACTELTAQVHSHISYNVNSLKWTGDCFYGLHTFIQALAKQVGPAHPASPKMYPHTHPMSVLFSWLRGCGGEGSPDSTEQQYAHKVTCRSDLHTMRFSWVLLCLSSLTWVPRPPPDHDVKHVTGCEMLYYFTHQHTYEFAQEGAVWASQSRGAVGRPRKIWNAVLLSDTHSLNIRRSK